MRKITRIAVLIAMAPIPWRVHLYADAAVIYVAKCKMCHGAGGQGNPAMRVPSFDLNKSEADLTQTIAEGKKPKMPAFKGKLSDAEIKEVVTYIRGLK